MGWLDDLLDLLDIVDDMKGLGRWVRSWRHRGRHKR